MSSRREARRKLLQANTLVQKLQIFVQKKLLPCAVHLNGEYGVKNIFAGAPVIIGKNGVEKIDEISLDENEKKQFTNN